MTGYILKRTLQAIPILLGASTLIFFLMHAAPGDPTSIYIRPDIDPAVIEQMRKNLGLDQPVHVQYVKWISSFAQGDFGYSFSQKRPIIDII
ncbi:MAG: diguanylate cyclase, partial [Gemmatimonadota bacterium]